MHKACTIYYLCLCILLVTLIQTSCLKRKNILDSLFLICLRLFDQGWQCAVSLRLLYQGWHNKPRDNYHLNVTMNIITAVLRLTTGIACPQTSACTLACVEVQNPIIQTFDCAARCCVNKQADIWLGCTVLCKQASRHLTGLHGSV